MDKVSFDSTEVAFRIKSRRELRKAHFLFRAISSRLLVGIGGFLSKIAIHLHLPIGWIVKPTIYSHFCGGETIEDCLPTVKKLAAHGVRSVLDYSVEGGEDPAVMEAALEETLRTVINAAGHENIPFTVFKPTAFCKNSVLEKASNGSSLSQAEEAEAVKFRRRVNRLCRTAYERDVRIMIDAEDYSFQAFIDEVVTEMMQQYNQKKAIVYNTYQMYRRDRMEYFRKDLARCREYGYYLGIKFVRGAYMERERKRAEEKGYPSPIHPDKIHTDRDYDAALALAMENIDRVSIFNGTHNETSSYYLCTLMEQHGLERDDPRCWFSQLYGMSDHISFNLAYAGYNVAKYLPYGPVRHVLPYLIRRTEENTSIAGQTSRELQLIRAEVARRKARKKEGNDHQ